MGSITKPDMITVVPAPTRIIAFVLFLAVSAALAACGSKDEKAVGQREKVTIACSRLPYTALDQIAAAKGYYAREGLTVTRQSYQNGKQALQAMLDGRADFATVAETPVMLAIMKGGKITIIATIDTARGSTAIIARKDRGISEFGDLKGKKIATVFGAFSEFFMDTSLILHGIARKEITVVNLPHEKLLSALEHGDVDAISIWYPLPISAQKKPEDGFVTFLGEGYGTMFSNMVATQDFIRKKPEVVKKVLRALIRAEAFVNSEPAEAQKIIAETCHLEKAFVKELWGNNSFRLDLGQPLILALEDESSWAMKNGLTGAEKIPNYLNNIYIDGLKALKPDAVRISR